MLSPDSDTVCARPHVLETAAPALQGPLNAGLDSLRDASRGSDACALALSVPVVSGRAVVVAGTRSSSSSSGGGVCALLSGFSSGSVYAHALELSQLLPAWHDATPQCAYSMRGEVAAVRYDCEAVPLLPAASAAADRAAAAEQDGCSVPGAPLLLSPLLLLDVLHVNLQAVDAQQCAGDGGDDGDGRPHAAAAAASSRPPQATTRRRSRGTTGTAAWAAADSDEESDAGYDPDPGGGGGGGSAGPLSLVSGSSGAAGAPAAGWPGARAAAAGALAPYPHGGGGFGVQDDDDDDDDDCDARLSELRRVVLHAAPELPGRFWVVHDQGVWGVNVRWLPMLLDWLAAAEQGGSVGMHALRAQTGTLPPPALQELLLTPGGVAATAVVGSSLLGSGCVVLEAGDGGGLLLLRPRPAGVLGPHQGDGSTAMDGTTATDMQCAADAVDDAAASAGAVTALSAQLAAAATLSADERDARARLEASRASMHMPHCCILRPVPGAALRLPLVLICCCVFVLLHIPLLQCVLLPTTPVNYTPALLCVSSRCRQHHARSRSTAGLLCRRSPWPAPCGAATAARQPGIPQRRRPCWAEPHQRHGQLAAAHTCAVCDRCTRRHAGADGAAS